MRDTLTEDDQEIPAPRMRPAVSADNPQDGDSGPDVEMAMLTEGRTHIAPGGVQITLEALQAGSPPNVRLVFRTDKEESATEFRAKYGEGIAFGVLYKIDIDGEEATLRVEPTKLTGPIDVATAGDIAKKDFTERMNCDGERMQAVGNTNGTVSVRVMRGEEEVVCATTVGLYTRAIVE